MIGFRRNKAVSLTHGMRRMLWQRVGSSSSRRLCCNALHRARPHPELLGNLVQASPLRLRQPLKAASVKCIRAQFRTRDLLRDFRRPRPCCTHGCLPPIEPLLSPAHYFRRSKKLLPRHFHDPPPDRARTPSDDSDNAPRSRPSHGHIAYSNLNAARRDLLRRPRFLRHVTERTGLPRLAGC